MPLTMVSVNEPNTIIRIGGKEETRRFLENLGFVPGGVVTVISCLSISTEKEDDSMPLTMVSVNEPNTIIRIGGKEETRRFLENLGFVPGGVVTVISASGGNMIVEIKGARIAIGKDMANKIIV